MSERCPGTGQFSSRFAEKSIGEIVGEAPQRQIDRRLLEELDLTFQVGQAILTFLGSGAVLGRSAPDPRGDPGSGEEESVLAVDGFGLIRKSRPMKSSKQPISGSVSGEQSAGSIGSVSPGGETDDDQLSLGITKSWNRTSPVGLVFIGFTTSDGHLFAPGDKPGA